MKVGWEHFPHEADMGVRGFGSTRAQAFEQAALGLMNVIANTDTIAPSEQISIDCRAVDDELLLVDWLNALVYEIATRGWLFSEFHVQIDDHQLRAIVAGEPVDIERHQPAVEVKGATFTALRVAREPDGWVAQCVVDV